VIKVAQTKHIALPAATLHLTEQNSQKWHAVTSLSKNRRRRSRFGGMQQGHLTRQVYLGASRDFLLKKKTLACEENPTPTSFKKTREGLLPPDRKQR